MSRGSRALRWVVLALLPGCGALADYGNWESSQAGPCVPTTNADATCINYYCCPAFDACSSDDATAAHCSDVAAGICPAAPDPATEALQACLVTYCGAPACTTGKP